MFMWLTITFVGCLSTPSLRKYNEQKCLPVAGVPYDRALLTISWSLCILV